MQLNTYVLGFLKCHQPTSFCLLPSEDYAVYIGCKEKGGCYGEETLREGKEREEEAEQSYELKISVHISMKCEGRKIWPELILADYECKIINNSAS